MGHFPYTYLDPGKKSGSSSPESIDFVLRHLRKIPIKWAPNISLKIGGHDQSLEQARINCGSKIRCHPWQRRRYDVKRKRKETETVALDSSWQHAAVSINPVQTLQTSPVSNHKETPIQYLQNRTLASPNLKHREP